MYDIFWVYFTPVVCLWIHSGYDSGCNGAFLGYILGMTATIIVMNWFHYMCFALTFFVFLYSSKISAVFNVYIGEMENTDKNYPITVKVYHTSITIFCDFLCY